jgi:hypothetical protein
VLTRTAALVHLLLGEPRAALRCLLDDACARIDASAQPERLSRAIVQALDGVIAATAARLHTRTPAVAGATPAVAASGRPSSLTSSLTSSIAPTASSASALERRRAALLRDALRRHVESGLPVAFMAAGDVSLRRAHS